MDATRINYQEFPLEIIFQLHRVVGKISHSYDHFYPIVTPMVGPFGTHPTFTPVAGRYVEVELERQFKFS